MRARTQAGSVDLEKGDIHGDISKSEICRTGHKWNAFCFLLKVIVEKNAENSSFGADQMKTLLAKIENIGLCV